VLEEAEAVRRIFHSYLYEKKGAHLIAKELNNNGIFTVNGKLWEASTVTKILKNEKYLGDLTQWKYYTADFLTGQHVKNKGEVPVVHIPNHHEGIISREIWDEVQKQLAERGALKSEGKKYSNKYWFSSKMSCGKCGSQCGINPSSKFTRTIRYTTRAKFGKELRVDANGDTVGYDNKGVNENVLSFCMKHILEHIQESRENIINDLLIEIQKMQKNEKSIDVKQFETEIEKLSLKKRNAIDLMLESIISKDDLKEQTAFYENEVVRLTEEINKCKNINVFHNKQISEVKAFIAEVNKTAEIESDDTEFYGELLKKIVIHENNVLDYYLNCVPFGFRLTYHKKYLYEKDRELVISITSFSVIN